MIEVRRTTIKEKAKHNNMPYLIDLGHTKQWFSEKALIEILGKIQIIVNEITLHVDSREFKEWQRDNGITRIKGTDRYKWKDFNFAREFFLDRFKEYSNKIN